MKYKLIYIEWADAISNSSWRHDPVDWAENADDWIVRQVGWVIKETPKYILIAGNWCPESDRSDEQWGNLQKIPKTWIRKRKILKI